MNKTAIKNFAVWARVNLKDAVTQRAFEYEITKGGELKTGVDAVNGRLLSAVEKKQRDELISVIRQKGYQQVIEEVAYTWFNRFVALRYMEVNGYLPSRVRVFTDENGDFKPDILREAMTVELDGLQRNIVFTLLDKQDNEGLYKYLLITQCNALSDALPGMFEKIENYTELLFPGNLLRADSIVGRMVSDIPEEDWTDAVQIIGWLYQYYNTELKDETFALLKKNVKISKERIPAATQLFTPDWIVRYMVENSLGRLWIEGHPNNELKSEWKYYLDEAEQEADVQAQLDQIRKEYATITPEQIKCIDPCCGSGHILAYMFDVLVQIYEAYGFTTREAVASIVENNLYGLDIDDRAAQLAYFAVMMKARQYDRRFFSRGIQPHVYAIAESNHVDSFTLDYFCNGDAKLTAAMKTIIEGLHDAKEYGSILNVTPQDWSALYARFDEIKEDINISRDSALRELLPLVQVAEALAQKYDAVVTNPPYMGSSGMSAKLTDFVKKNYPDSKSDLFAVFIERCGRMVTRNGYQAMITQHAWMFLSSFEKLRVKLLQVDTVNMAHLGARAFEEIGGEVVQTTSFVMRRSHVADYKGVYCRLIEPTSQKGKEDMFLAGENRYGSSKDNFSKIPGSPVAYWLSDNFLDLLGQEKTIGQTLESGSGLSTADNDRFLRFFWEVDYNKIAHGKNDNKKWYLFHKGGEFRKWYGNLFYVVNWENDGAEIKYWVTHNPKDPNTTSWSRRIFNTHLYFEQGVTWSVISSGDISFRTIDTNAMISNAAGGIFGFENTNQRDNFMAAINTKVWTKIFATINPTLNYSSGVIQKAPMPVLKNNNIGTECVALSKEDWDSFETSWDFRRHPMIGKYSSIAEAFSAWERQCDDRFNQLKANEEELNRIFIDIYGLQDELTPEEDDKDVTVRKADLQRDIKSFISYAVGCMFGRYSLDVDGLAYAGGDFEDYYRKDRLVTEQGDTITFGGVSIPVSKDYTQVKVNGQWIDSTLPVDGDNIIPICDDEYFEDDIVGKFVQFVRAVYGEETLERNLKFIADALGGKGTPRGVIRNYFLSGFYEDHLKIYQKRPIYWLFDSGKKNGFKALVYMHRYQPDLLARMRTDYVHEQQERYRTQLSLLEESVQTASAPEKVKLNKQIDKLRAQETEIRVYEEKVHHLADQMIAIDLDDGVKVNYAKFQDVLAKIK